MDCLELLDSLCLISGPSGYEAGLASYVGSLMRDAGFQTNIDAVGNLICRKVGPAGRKLMFVAHCDEVGFVVKHISSEGFIYFAGLGRTDLPVLLGRHVIISHMGGGNVAGVIGHIPHSLGGDGKVDDISSLWIDIGARSKEAAEKKVSVGDSITVTPVFSELGDGLVSCKSMDNRAGMASLIMACSKIKGIELPFDLYVVFSAQEEIGLIGATTASYAISPDICIAIDVTHSTDTPNVDRRKFGDICLNKGPVIPIGSNLSKSVQDIIRADADEGRIPYQIEALPGFSGTDIAQVQVARSGCLTGLVSIPCRYMHSPAEVVSLNDIRNSSLLLERIMKSNGLFF